MGDRLIEVGEDGKIDLSWTSFYQIYLAEKTDNGTIILKPAVILTIPEYQELVKKSKECNL